MPKRCCFSSEGSHCPKSSGTIFNFHLPETSGFRYIFPKKQTKTAQPWGKCPWKWRSKPNRVKYIISLPSTIFFVHRASHLPIEPILQDHQWFSSPQRLVNKTPFQTWPERISQLTSCRCYWRRLHSLAQWQILSQMPGRPKEELQGKWMQVN